MRKAAFLLTAGFALMSPVLAKDIVIHAGALLDGISATPRKQVSILVHDDRIVAIEPGFIQPIRGEVIDLSGETVMPGFIDAHIHIAGRLPSKVNATEYWLTHSDIDRAFDGAVFARAMLQQGFTAGRDVGGGDDTVSLRDAIDAGKVPGPHLLVSLEPLGPTGGHGDARTGLDPRLDNPDWGRGLVNSAEEGRLRVREHKRRGANLIKMMPSGGIASTGDDPRHKVMTDDEIKSVIDTAHELGMKVAAHTYPSPAIDAAVKAGVDSIEHGSFATMETFALMKAKGTYLVPTLTVFDVYYKAASEHPELLTPGTAEKELANDPLPAKNFPNALKAGVRIALGSDIGEGDHAQEFTLMIDNGMKPVDALFAGTRNAADLLGISKDAGSVEKGKWADLVAVKGDPLADPSLFRKVDFVMKGGRVYREKGMPTAIGAGN